MMTRLAFTHRLFSIGFTIQWADSAYLLPSAATAVVRPPMGMDAAAFDGGNGMTTGQSYRGVHPPR